MSYIPSINLSYRLDNENAQLYDAIIKSLQNTLDSIEFGLWILLVIQGLSLIIPNFNF